MPNNQIGVIDELSDLQADVVNLVGQGPLAEHVKNRLLTSCRCSTTPIAFTMVTHTGSSFRSVQLMRTALVTGFDHNSNLCWLGTSSPISAATAAPERARGLRSAETGSDPYQWALVAVAGNNSGKMHGFHDAVAVTVREPEDDCFPVQIHRTAGQVQGELVVECARQIH